MRSKYKWIVRYFATDDGTLVLGMRCVQAHDYREACQKARQEVTRPGEHLEGTPPDQIYIQSVDMLLGRNNRLNFAKEDRDMTNAYLGPQEPPSDPMIYNRRQEGGTFRNLDDFFDTPFVDADRRE